MPKISIFSTLYTGKKDAKKSDSVSLEGFLDKLDKRPYVSWFSEATVINDVFNRSGTTVNEFEERGNFVFRNVPIASTGKVATKINAMIDNAFDAQALYVLKECAKLVGSKSIDNIDDLVSKNKVVLFGKKEFNDIYEQIKSNDKNNVLTEEKISEIIKESAKEENIMSAELKHGGYLNAERFQIFKEFHNHKGLSESACVRYMTNDYNGKYREDKQHFYEEASDVLLNSFEYTKDELNKEFGTCFDSTNKLHSVDGKKLIELRNKFITDKVNEYEYENEEDKKKAVLKEFNKINYALSAYMFVTKNDMTYLEADRILVQGRESLENKLFSKESKDKAIDFCEAHFYDLEDKFHKQFPQFNAEQPTGYKKMIIEVGVGSMYADCYGYYQKLKDIHANRPWYKRLADFFDFNGERATINGLKWALRGMKSSLREHGFTDAEIRNFKRSEKGVESFYIDSVQKESMNDTRSKLFNSLNVKTLENNIVAYEKSVMEFGVLLAKDVADVKEVEIEKDVEKVKVVAKDVEEIDTSAKKEEEIIK